MTEGQLRNAIARIIDPDAFDGPGDPSTPTERSMWEEYGPLKRNEARRKATAIMAIIANG